MNDTARGERLQIMLTQEELEALDNWRFDRRMPSRAAAVRELLKRGLADVSAGAEKRSRSNDGTRRSSGSTAIPRSRPHATNARALADAALDAKP